MPDKQPTRYKAFVVFDEDYTPTTFDKSSPTDVYLAADYDTLARFTERLLYEAEEDAVGVSEPGWLAKLRDEFDAKWPGRTG